MIESTEALQAYLDSLSSGFCALDTEADSLHRYHEKLCLMQYTDGENHALIDPLAIEDMQPLVDVLKDAEVWMHGADYDIMILRRDLNVVPPVIWDTQIGARLLGSRKFGYGNLVEEFIGVELCKASQKADWSKRPLTPKMEQYAINDVLYLKPIADKIVAGLKEKGRYEWFVESCEVARAKVLDRPQGKEDPWRIKGSGRLSPRGLAVLRALWYWRDEEARQWDRPCFMVCGNKQLIEWVGVVLEGKSPTLPKHFRTNRRKRFFAAVKEASEVPNKLLPQKIRGEGRRVKDEAFEARVADLLAKRESVASELDIDPSLLGSRAVFEAFAANEQPAEELFMSWQRELLGL